MNSESGHLEEPGPHASGARPHGMRSSSSTAQARSESALSTSSRHSARPRPRPIRRASGRRKKWGRTPTARPLAAQSGYPRALSTQIQADAAIQERAEGRARVPQKFSDGCKVFLFSATGLLKILRLALIVGAVACFITGRAHEAFIAITIQEICIVLFFILIYLVSLQHLLICLHWPLLDLINSIISTIFLLVVAVLTIQEKGRRQLYYIGGSLCLGAAILCCIDALLVIKVIRNKMKEEQAAKETLQSSLH